LPVPVVVHVAIDRIDRSAQADLGGIGGAIEKLAGAEQSLDHVRRFHDIAAVVLGAEGDGSAGSAIDPVRKGAVIGGDVIREEIDDGGDTVERVGARDEITLYADEHGHDAEAAAAGSDLGLGGAFFGHSADGVVIRPEIIEGLLFDQGKEGGVGDAREFVSGVDGCYKANPGGIF